MPQCYVETCGNYYEKTRGSKEIIYHMLPGDPALAIKWIRACGKKEQKMPYYARVCSNHFSEKCYQRDLQHELLGLPLRKKLKPGAIPDKNLPKHQKQKTKRDSPNNAIETLKNGGMEELEVDKPTAKRKITSTEVSNDGQTNTKTAYTSDIQQKKKITFLTRNLTKPIIINCEQKSNARKTVIINSSPEIPEIEILAQNSATPMPKKPSTKIFEFKKSEEPFSKQIFMQELTNEVLKEKEDKDRSSKVNNKINRLPIRSSFRIAKKKSIESLSDSFTEKINNKTQTNTKSEKFTDKLKFMAKLQLKFERKENYITLPKYDLEASLDKMMKQECFSNSTSSNKARFHPSARDVGITLLQPGYNMGGVY